MEERGREERKEKKRKMRAKWKSLLLRLEAMCASCACGHAADKPLGTSRDMCSNPCVCHEVKDWRRREKKKKGVAKFR